MTRHFSRRGFLAGLGGAAIALPAAESDFIDDLARRSFLFFVEQADANTGLVRDRAQADNRKPDERNVASSAATGFGLTGLCIASERGWLKRAEARERALSAIRFYGEKSFHQNGWFYHFVDTATGTRLWNCEISSIDTALLLAGMLTARQYFKEEPEIARLVDLIYKRIDFQWMLNGDPYLLSMGWHPENGFIASRWDTHCELGILYLLGIGSPGKPLPAECWDAWKRPVVTYAGQTYISGAAPLFVHQYTQAWFDFRRHPEKRAPFTNWQENSIKATLAHRQFCIDRGYGENLWGLTSSDSAHGYVAWGGPPADGPIDGTVVPCAAGGSLMFAPAECRAALVEMNQKFASRIYKRYGFVDAFHPTNGWTNPDVIGIDLGITLLSAENLRTGAVWKWFMSCPEMIRAQKLLFR